MMLARVHELVSHTLPQWKNADFRDVEVAIALIYNLGEAIPVIEVGKKKIENGVRIIGYGFFCFSCFIFFFNHL